MRIICIVYYCQYIGIYCLYTVNILAYIVYQLDKFVDGGNQEYLTEVIKLKKKKRRNEKEAHLLADYQSESSSLMF